MDYNTELEMALDYYKTNGHWPKYGKTILEHFDGIQESANKLRDLIENPMPLQSVFVNVKQYD